METITLTTEETRIIIQALNTLWLLERDSAWDKKYKELIDKIKSQLK